MHKRRRVGWSEERFLIVAGVLGVGAATFLACDSDSKDDDTSETAGSGGASANAGSGGSATVEAGAGGSSSSGTQVSCESSSSTADNTSAVVDAAKAFLDALSADQQSAAKYDKTLANAQQWSNFPTTFVQRNGVRIGDMSSDAQAKAVALAEVASGDVGAKLLSELREADEWLVTDGKASSTDYGRGLYYFSIHGTPSTSDAWMLQIAGHHLAYNFTYNGKCTSATPLFDGVEPTTWTDGDGNDHAPLEAQRAAMVALLASVSGMSDAKLTGTFSDLVNGPAGGGAPGMGGMMMGTGTSSGGGDTKYPSQLTYPTGTSGRGVSVGSLSSDQKALVKTAIEAWVKNVADPVSSALLDVYESDDALAQTYVGFSGSADLSTQTSYVRIDGPRVWIEVTIQGGIVYHDRVHYHTIWRDKAADYGAEYAGS